MGGGRKPGGGPPPGRGGPPAEGAEPGDGRMTGAPCTCGRGIIMPGDGPPMPCTGPVRPYARRFGCKGSRCCLLFCVQCWASPQQCHFQPRRA